MGIINSIRRALRGGKALPNEHGPRFIKRDEIGRWFEVESEAVESKCGENCKCKDSSVKSTVEVTIEPATTDDKPTTVPKPRTRKPKLEQVIEDSVEQQKLAAKLRETKLAEEAAEAKAKAESKPKAKAKPATKKAAPKKK